MPTEEREKVETASLQKAKEARETTTEEEKQPELTAVEENLPALMEAKEAEWSLHSCRFGGSSGDRGEGNCGKSDKANNTKVK